MANQLVYVDSVARTLPAALNVPSTVVREVRPSGGDDAAAINAALSAAASGSVVRLAGAYTISGPVTVPAGVRLDAHGATITQTGSGQQTVILGGDGAQILGGELVGRGAADYVAGSATVNASGIRTVSTTGCRVEGVTVRGFAGPGIIGLTTTGLTIANCRVTGVGAPTITAGSAGSCWGVYLDTNAIETTISNTTISACNQGIITGLSVTHLTISNVRIHDIPGQHGCYIQNATGLVISGLRLRTINLNGVKVQLGGTSTGDSNGASITGVVAHGCGDNAIIASNIAADLTSAYRLRGVSISGVTAVDCYRVLYLGSLRGASVTNVSAYNTGGDGITLIDCQDLHMSNLALDVVGRVGFRFTNSTGSMNRRITVAGLRINNAANNNVASNIWGVYINQGDYVTFDDLTVTADNGFMQYGLFLGSSTATDQQTFSLRNADLRGDTGVSARFQATVTNVRDWTNNRMSGSVLNKPNGVTPVTAVP